MSKLSLQEFRDKYVGKSADVPWGFTGECVSLVQRYLNESFGLPLVRRGNAKDYGQTLLNQGLAKKVSQAQYGDLIVYGSNYGGGYGHIGIYINSKTILDQNNSSVKPVKTAQFRPMLNNWMYIIRMNEPLKPDQPKYEKEEWAFTANTNINIRENHRTNAKILGTLKPGVTYNYIQKYVASNYVWVSNGTTWVAVREIKNGKRQELWGKLHNPYTKPTKIGIARIKPNSVYRSKAKAYDQKPVPKSFINKPMKYELGRVKTENWVYFFDIRSYVDYKDVDFTK